MRILTGIDSPLTEDYWNRINVNSLPHEIFNLEWSQYTTRDFADSFLPNTTKITGSNILVQDGAELFLNYSKTNLSKKLYGETEVIALSVYSYPKGTAAQDKKNRVRTNYNEVAVFFETDQDGKLSLYFNFGTKFQYYISKATKESGKNLTELIGRSYSTTRENIEHIFNGSFSHYAMMGFILKILGIEMESDAVTDLVIFFRSPSQAAGLPALIVPKDAVDKSVKVETPDSEYSQSFGFDIYRPDLYGESTHIYKLVDNGSVDSGQTINNQYDVAGNLSLKLTNGSKEGYISKEYKIEKGAAVGETSYLIPNLLASPGRTFTFYGKHFSMENKELTTQLSFSTDNPAQQNIDQSITNYPVEVKFKKNEITPITITCGTAFDEPIYLNLHNKETLVGRMKLLPNKQMDANYLFVDVIYKGAGAADTAVITNADAEKLDDYINNKVLSQSAILMNRFPSRDSITIAPDDSIFDDFGKPGVQFQRYLDNLKIGKDHINNVLNTVKYIYYKGIVLDVLTKMDQKFKSILVNRAKGKPNLLDDAETVEKVLKSTSDGKEDTYYKVVNRMIYFLQNLPLNFYPAFQCGSIESDGNELAIATIAGPGIFLPKDSFKSLEDIAHEMGHNLGLCHTFYAKDKTYDLRLKERETKENFMDYVLPQNRKSLITFQWRRMRENLAEKTAAIELEIKKGDRIYPYLDYTNRNQNNDTFTLILFQDFATYVGSVDQVNLDYTDKQQKEILQAIIDSIKETFQERCGN